VLNIGSIRFTYGEQSSVQYGAKPFLFFDLDEEIKAVFSGQVTPDIVNCQRTLYEFLAISENHLQMPVEDIVYLCDGSLIFWHLEAKESELKDYFLSEYLKQLHTYYEQKILHAGYISAPKSKELINVVRAHAHNQGENVSFDYLVDTDILWHMLKPYTRTIMFENKAPIAKSYPTQVKPYFCYVHCGEEIARVEMPSWIAQDEHKREHVLQVVIDQAKKGSGYPISLAEAHEQAVIQERDRQFFYQALERYVTTSGSRYAISKKSSHKRRIGI
jgi:hypothetical protein